MKRLPIFQLVWGNSHNDKFGLMFPSELEYESASFTYAIPVQILDGNQRPNYSQLDQVLFSTRYYFPVDVAGLFTPIEGRIDESKVAQNNYSIGFRMPDGQLASFEIDVYATRSFYRLKGMKITSLNKYVGKYRHGIFDTCAFIPLNPMDVSILNEAFRVSKIIFVGQTSTYGEIQFG